MSWAATDGDSRLEAMSVVVEEAADAGPVVLDVLLVLLLLLFLLLLLGRNGTAPVEAEAVAAAVARLATNSGDAGAEERFLVKAGRSICVCKGWTVYRT